MILSPSLNTCTWWFISYYCCLATSCTRKHEHTTHLYLFKWRTWLIEFERYINNQFHFQCTPLFTTQSARMQQPLAHLYFLTLMEHLVDKALDLPALLCMPVTIKKQVHNYDELVIVCSIHTYACSHTYQCTHMHILTHAHPLTCTYGTNHIHVAAQFIH